MRPPSATRAFAILAAIVILSGCTMVNPKAPEPPTPAQVEVGGLSVKATLNVTIEQDHAGGARRVRYVIESFTTANGPLRPEEVQWMDAAGEQLWVQRVVYTLPVKQLLASSVEEARAAEVLGSDGGLLSDASGAGGGGHRPRVLSEEAKSVTFRMTVSAFAGDGGEPLLLYDMEDGAWYKSRSTRVGPRIEPVAATAEWETANTRFTSQRLVALVPDAILQPRCCPIRVPVAREHVTDFDLEVRFVGAAVQVAVADNATWVRPFDVIISAHNVSRSAWLDAPDAVGGAMLGGHPFPASLTRGTVAGPGQSLVLMFDPATTRSVAVTVPHANVTGVLDIEHALTARVDAGEAMVFAWTVLGERGWRNVTDPASWYAEPWSYGRFSVVRSDGDALVSTLRLPVPEEEV